MCDRKTWNRKARCARKKNLDLYWWLHLASSKVKVWNPHANLNFFTDVSLNKNKNSLEKFSWKLSKRHREATKGKQFISRCQFSIDYNKESSLNFVKNLKISSKRTRSLMVEVFDARTNDRLINVQGEFWWEELSGMKQRTNIPSRKCNNWFNIISLLQCHWKGWVQEGVQCYTHGLGINHIDCK